MIDPKKEDRFHELTYKAYETELVLAEVKELAKLDSYIENELCPEFFTVDGARQTQQLESLLESTKELLEAVKESKSKHQLAVKELTLREALSVESDMRLSCYGRWLIVEYGDGDDCIVYSRPRSARVNSVHYRGSDINQAYKILKGDEDE